MLDYLRPVSPLFPYIGGKRNLAPAIVEMIGAIPHHLYAEPFVGAGGVFLRRPMATPVEVINDRSRDIATFSAYCSATTRRCSICSNGSCRRGLISSA